MNGYSVSTLVLGIAAVVALVLVFVLVKLIVKVVALVIAVLLGVAAWQVYAHRSASGSPPPVPAVAVHGSAGPR
ncbi:MAG: hypothetical protein ACR2F6_15630 [Mycobacteriales bacterium]